MTTTSKQNKIFKVIAVIALLWNLMGLFMFLASTFMKETMAESYTAAEMELQNALPSWYYIFFGTATIVGVLASITMLMRKKVTVMLFLISLIAVLVTQGYWLFGVNAMEVMGNEAAIMPMVVIIISIFLYFYNKGAKQIGLLHS
jgi:hypothetical protein